MDKKTLAEKLAALSSDGEKFENGLRVISDGSEPPILTAILGEADMTVLPRKLTFRMNASEVTLVAGGRRLRGLVKASKDIKGVMGVLGKPLAREETDLLDGLRAILDQFTAAAGQLTVESDNPDAMGGQTDAGITASALAEIWNVPLHIAPVTPMQGFLRDCGTVATAWIILANDSDNVTGGDGTKLEALQNALSAQWDTFSQSVEHLTGDQGFICLNNALGASGSVAIVTGAGEAALICYDEDDMTELHSLWLKSSL